MRSCEPRRTRHEPDRRRALESDRRQGVSLPDANLALTGRHDGLHPAAGWPGLGDLLVDDVYCAQLLQRGPRGELRPGSLSLSRPFPDGVARLYHPRTDGRRHQQRTRAADHRSVVCPQAANVLDPVGAVADIDVIPPITLVT